MEAQPLELEMPRAEKTDMLQDYQVPFEEPWVKLCPINGSETTGMNYIHKTIVMQLQMNEAVIYKLTNYLNNNNCNGHVNTRQFLSQIYEGLAGPSTSGLGWEPAKRNAVSPRPVG